MIDWLPCWGSGWRSGLGIVLGLSLATIGCGAGERPEDVARLFWEAVRDGDVQTAKRLASTPSAGLVEPTVAELSIGTVLVGEPLRNAESALVATTLVTVQDGAELDASFHTYLVREEERWRVDVASSRAELRKGIFVAGMRGIGEAVGEGVNEIGEVLRQGAEELQDALREALDELEGGSRL
ncbi:MAG: hypothetical protein ABFS46_01550 [Myxococcota bacterium]